MGLFDIKRDIKSSVRQVERSVNKGASEVSRSLSSISRSSSGRSSSTDRPSTGRPSTARLSTGRPSIGRSSFSPNRSIIAPKGQIATISALRVLYLLMASDGQITGDEEETFRQMAEELNPKHAEHLDVILKACKMLVEENAGQPDFYETLQEGVKRVLEFSIPTADSFITPKLLIWDMMAIAYSDGSYDENEKKLIAFTADFLRLDHAIYLELESSIETMNDLLAELKWIKTTDRPYLVIETMVNEIEDRKNVIMESIRDLITL